MVKKCPDCNAIIEDGKDFCSNCENRKKTKGKSFFDLFDRQNFLYGISFIGVGIIFFIITLWIQPLIYNIDNSPWLDLSLRITGVVCIFAGVIGIIASLIPKKKGTRTEQK